MVLKISLQKRARTSNPLGPAHFAVNQGGTRAGLAAKYETDSIFLQRGRSARPISLAEDLRQGG